MNVRTPSSGMLYPRMQFASASRRRTSCSNILSLLSIQWMTTTRRPIIGYMNLSDEASMERTRVAGSRTSDNTARRRTRGSLEGRALLALAAAVLVAFLLLPVAAIFIRAAPSGTVRQALRDDVVRSALSLSLITTGVTLVLTLVFGTPLAYLLARGRFPGRDLLDTLVDLPMVLPPAVAGVGLLMAFGRRGVFGPLLDSTFGVTLPFTTTAVVLAQTFVAAPFFIRAAKTGFGGVDHELEDAASLDASPLRVFWSVTMPLSFPSLLGGAVMTWARALGEFGATIMFAGNFQGRTQTMPLAIYQTLESGRLDSSLVLSAVLVVVSFSVLAIFKVVVRLGGPDAGAVRG